MENVIKSSQSLSVSRGHSVIPGPIESFELDWCRRTLRAASQCLQLRGHVRRGVLLEQLARLSLGILPGGRSVAPGLARANHLDP